MADKVLKLGGKMKTVDMYQSALVELYECTRCGCTDMKPEDCTRQTFAGNREEPPEYELACPECGAEVREMYAFWCKTCEDVKVDDDDTNCPECHALTIEAQLDAMREGNS